ncbi:MAG: hypothetical protein K6E51_11470 [Treponema sp.]|nr:hypothetical protein [Treponema sp.]
MTKPTISPNFTIDDIHKIREYNWEQTKDLSPAEQIAYYHNKALAFLNEAGIVTKEKNTDLKQKIM